MKITRKMRTIYLIGGIAFAAGQFALARLGETPKQIEARFGPVQENRTTLTTNDSCLYRSGGLNILIHFSDGVSDAELYKRPYGDVDALNDRTVKALLEIHAQGYTWTEVPVRGDCNEYWKRSDGHAWASANTDLGWMMVYTPEFHEKQQQHLKTNTQEKLNGF